MARPQAKATRPVPRRAPRYIYAFGAGRTDGRADMKNLTAVCLLLSAVPLSAAPARPAASGPPLVVLSIDALHPSYVLEADRLGYAVPRLAFRDLEGFINGFIDLVFEHEGRYYVLDWKSNHLGHAPSDYGQAPVAAAMALRASASLICRGRNSSMTAISAASWAACSVRPACS